jgi:hypothetical protein
MKSHAYPVKIIFRKIRPLFFCFFGLLLFEGLLQLGTFFVEGPLYFDFYWRISRNMAAASDPEKTVYFVGDSTVYGIGASEPATYSLPAQFEKLLQKINPQIKVINLGYPGTCTEDHLAVISRLPPNSTIIYRGGVADFFNRQGHYRLMLFGRIIDLRILKIFSLLFYKSLPGFYAGREQNIRNEFEQIMKSKKHNIYAVEYNNAGHNNKPMFYTQKSYHKIPLFNLLKEQGLIDGHIFQQKYLGDGSHPNNIGYYIQAVLLFNYFCRQQMLGLKPECVKVLELNNKFTEPLKKRYSELKKKFRSYTETPFGLFKIFQIWRWQHDFYELILLVQLLKEQDKTDLELQQEYRSLEKLGILVFHNTSIAGSFFEQLYIKSGKQEKPDNDAMKKMEVFYLSMKALFPTNSKLWNVVNQNYRQLRTMHNSQHESFEKKQLTRITGFIPYWSLIAPYPLEFCERFLTESGISAEDIDTRHEWEYFFSIPYDKFRERNINICTEK